MTTDKPKPIVLRKRSLQEQLLLFHGHCYVRYHELKEHIARLESEIAELQKMNIERGLL